MTEERQRHNTRHIAAHIVETPAGKVSMGVVDIVDGNVVGWHAMQGEEPRTEWLGGVITITRRGETLRYERR